MRGFTELDTLAVINRESSILLSLVSLCLLNKTLLRLRHSALMSAYFAEALWPAHIYKSIKEKEPKYFILSED